MAATTSLSSSACLSKQKEADDGSFVNVVAFCFVLLGIGALFGYFSFYVIFQEKCTELLTESNRVHNESHAEIQTKYAKALVDIRQCEEDSQAKNELHEMQGRLHAQALLADKHQALLERHEKTLGRIADLQETQEGSSHRIEMLQNELHEIQGLLDQSTKEHDDMQRDLNSKMTVTTNNLKERVRENSKLRVEVNQCQRKSKLNDDKLADLTRMLQKRNKAAVVTKWGKGPFVVRFLFQFPTGPAEPNLFDVEIFNPEVMPHTVWTFLTLVNEGLYIDTSIESADSDVIKLGSPGSVTHSQLHAQVERRYEEAGFSTDNALFTDMESSNDASCRQFSFGMNHRGPGFSIHMSNDIKVNQNKCPGLVVNGRDTLVRIKEIFKQSPGTMAGKIPIVEAFILSAADAGHQEL